MSNAIEHQLHILSPVGVPLDILSDGTFAALNYGFRDIEPGVLEFILPAGYAGGIISEEFQVEVYRAVGAGSMQLEGETTFFIRRVHPSTNASGIKTIQITAYSALELLTRRIVAYYAGTSYTDKVDIPWDNLAREIMRENYGSLVSDTTRNLSPWLTIQTDTNWGPSYTKTMPWREVLLVLQEIVQDVRGQGIYCTFDVVRTAPSTFEFRVYLGPRGTDHTASSALPVIVSEERMNLLEPSLDFDWTDERNYIYATGQGQEDQRVLKTAQDDTRIGISPFNRREMNKDARQAELEASVQSEANTALEENRPKRTFTGTISQTDGCIYGVHWKWGDIVTAEYLGYTFDCHVDAVTVAIDPNGTEIVTGHLRSVSDVS